MKQLALALLALTALFATASCSRSGDRLGAGPDVDLCAGWELVDRLDEPDLSDRAATLRWAEGVQRIVERIDLRREVDDEPVPSAVAARLDQVDDAMSEFVEELRAGDEGAVERAFVELTTGGFDASSDRLTDFWRRTC